jgi:hypothetical protein
MRLNNMCPDAPEWVNASDRGSEIDIQIIRMCLNQEEAYNMKKTCPDMSKFNILAIFLYFLTSSPNKIFSHSLEYL